MSGRGLKIALGVSLVVNVFVVGAVAGALYMRAHAPAGGARAPGNPLLRAGDALSPADRDAFRQMLWAQAPAIRPLQQDAREARRETVALFTAPVFDRAAAAALLERARADDQRARRLVEEAVLDFTAKLPEPERAALADGIRKSARQRWMSRRAAAAGGQRP